MPLAEVPPPPLFSRKAMEKSGEGPSLLLPPPFPLHATLWNRGNFLPERMGRWVRSAFLRLGDYAWPGHSSFPNKEEDDSSAPSLLPLARSVSDQRETPAPDFFFFPSAVSGEGEGVRP